MKLLLSLQDTVGLGLIRSRLESAGIACELRNEHLSPALPGAPFDPELWVLNDTQFEEARTLVKAWQGGTQGEPD